MKSTTGSSSVDPDVKVRAFNNSGSTRRPSVPETSPSKVAAYVVPPSSASVPRGRSPSQVFRSKLFNSYQAEAYHKGVREYRNGNTDLALSKLGSLAKSFKDNPYVCFYYGMCLYEKGNTEYSKAYLHQAKAMGYESFSVMLFNVGVAYYKKLSFGRAEAVLQALRKYEERHAKKEYASYETLLQLSYVLASVSKNDKARAVLIELEKYYCGKCENSYGFYVVAGTVAFQSQKYEEAVRFFTKAGKMKLEIPFNIQLYVGLSMYKIISAKSAGESDGACPEVLDSMKTEFEKYESRNNCKAEILAQGCYLLSKLYKLNGMKDEADRMLEQYKQEVECCPESRIPEGF